MGSSFLVARSSSVLFALPIASVEEVVPCLKLQPLAGVPPFVLGLATIRGIAVPVIDPSRLLVGKAEESCSRFISVKLEGHRLLLAVEEVRGIRGLSADASQALPPWLNSTAADAIESIGREGGEMLLRLRPERLIPRAVLERIERRAA